ncbi:hypothetical protein EVAR_16586_1 [Eumeta japonica]|uniref:Uncharacterized protein n=1 Tax=Eumeta variegata TaxID=151549 RepID=A0A4C1U343_EUMVA|nr:hypothetical protein EVAR_16586_1 [Eumeta japonica]
MWAKGEYFYHSIKQQTNAITSSVLQFEAVPQFSNRNTFAGANENIKPHPSHPLSESKKLQVSHTETVTSRDSSAGTNRPALRRGRRPRRTAARALWRSGRLGLRTGADRDLTTGCGGLRDRGRCAAYISSACLTSSLANGG